MFVRELVQKHGLGIQVSCGKPGYPPFRVISKGEKENTFVCESDERDEQGQPRRFTMIDRLNDYQVVEEAQANSK